MQRFFVTPIKQEGRQYWMANYPSDQKPWSRRAPPRKQKKFAKLEEAEVFLAEAKREWVRRGGVKLGYDRELHYDFMRAVDELAGIPGGTLWKAALVYRHSVSWREYRGGKYEVPINRKVELSPREFLMVEGEARRMQATVGDALAKIIGWWVEKEAVKAIKERLEAERAEVVEIRKLREAYEVLLEERKELSVALRRARREQYNATRRAKRHLQGEIEDLKKQAFMNGYKVSIEPLEENADGNSGL
jgi:hypothetical protein